MCRKKTDSARLALKESVELYPFNWSAWKALQTVCAEWEDVIHLELPDSAARDFFFVQMCMTLHWHQEALSRMAKLNDVFPRSSWLVLKAGAAHYSMRKMEEAKVRTCLHCTAHLCLARSPACARRALQLFWQNICACLLERTCHAAPAWLCSRPSSIADTASIDAVLVTACRICSRT